MTIIRKATPKDMPRIKKIDDFSKILKTCSPLDHLDSKHKPKKGERDYFEKVIYGRNKWAYVAEDNKKIVGFILFNIENREPYWKIKKVGYIDLIFIVKAFRKKGISKLFMDKAYEIFKEKGLKYVKLTVQTDNKPAHNVWKKYGFKEFRTDLYKELK